MINRGGGAQDFCLGGWAISRQVVPNLQLGAEFVHQGADVRGGRSSTQVGFGAKCDVNATFHLLAYAGPSLQNIAQGDRYAWYASLLITM